MWKSLTELVSQPLPRMLDEYTVYKQITAMPRGGEETVLYIIPFDTGSTSVRAELIIKGYICGSIVCDALYTIYGNASEVDVWCEQATCVDMKLNVMYSTNTRSIMISFCNMLTDTTTYLFEVSQSAREVPR